MHPDTPPSPTSISPDQGLGAEITVSNKDDSMSAKSKCDSGDIGAKDAKQTKDEKDKSKSDTGNTDPQDAEQTKDEEDLEPEKEKKRPKRD